MAITIEKDGYFTSLPREYYLSSGIYERELRKVLARQWLLVGHTSYLKRAGDYFVAQVGPESLILVKDRTERIRAYFNVCRHRGFQICAAGASGNTKRFTCPYHAWSYDCEGKLLTSPGARDGREFSFSEWSLHEARCEVLYGFIYVYLDQGSPQSLSDTLPLSEQSQAAIRAVQPEQMKRIHREVYAFNANWKAVMENEFECYHCGVAHNSLTRSCDYVGFFTDAPSQAHFPLKKGMKTLSMDGDWVCSRRLGEPQPAGFSAGHVQGPLFGGPLFFADHALAMQLTPLSQDRAQLVCDWFVHEDAVEGVDYEVNKVIEIFHRTNLEDVELSERNYRGIQSMRYVPGPNSATRETYLRVALNQYLQMMDAP